jgi:hypothetical protein
MSIARGGHGARPSFSGGRFGTRPPEKEKEAMADKNGVTLEVVDQLHLSSVRADTMGEGERFKVSADLAKQLVNRGLARRVKSAESPANKAAPQPRTKPAGKPANK